jgi:hypothetical protein
MIGGTVAALPKQILPVFKPSLIVDPLTVAQRSSTTSTRRFCALKKNFVKLLDGLQGTRGTVIQICPKTTDIVLASTTENEGGLVAKALVVLNFVVESNQ